MSKQYKQVDFVTESLKNPRGGKRENAGRKSKFSEKTAAIRLPISIIEKLKSGNFEIITNSNNADYLKLKLENEKLTNENIALKNSLKEYIECVHFLKTKNDKLELSYQDDIDFLTPIQSYTYTTGKERPLNYLIVKNKNGDWFRKCTSLISDRFSFDSALTVVENDENGFFMMVFDKRINLKVTTIKKLPSYCLREHARLIKRIEKM